MTLSQCTKEDLLWIINRMCQRNLGPGKRDLEIALIDLAYKKEMGRISEAQKWSDVADEKRREYIAVLKPYEGKRFIDIPMSVLEKADKAMKEAQEADRKYAKLIGIA